jgi:hypothetical protein
MTPSAKIIFSRRPRAIFIANAQTCHRIGYKLMMPAIRSKDVVIFIIILIIIVLWYLKCGVCILK